MTALHGGDIYGGREILLDFSVNVNPLGMPEFVRKAAEESLFLCGRYPDSRCRGLRRAAAAWYQVDEEQMIFGNGAAELIFRSVLALRPGRAVLLAPSFYEYEAALRAVGAQMSFFYLKEEEDFHLPVDEYLAFLKKERPDMIFLCNPANPAGTVIARTELLKILDFCSDHGIFAVVDECFLDFLKEPGNASALDLVREGRAGVLILQALTKSFAMAGLRLGYGFLADRSLLASMEQAGQPWSVSIPAQEAGAAAFGAARAPYFSETRQLIERERAFLADGLEKAGFHVFPSQANFLLFKDRPGKPEGELFRFLLDHGILIRSCESFRGLDGRYYRSCVAGHDENISLLRILRDYL